MRFGIEFGSYPSDLDPVEVCRQVSERAEIAYRNNFEALFVAQHYLTGPDAAILQSIPLLAYLAGRVPGMYLGTSIFLLPLHHPVMVAEYIATLDNLCGGKTLFGIGQGYRDSEFNSFGIDKRQRRGRLVEGLEVIRRLWSGDKVTLHGKYFRLDGVTSLPRPLQRPGPPILMGADLVKTVARVPRWPTTGSPAGVIRKRFCARPCPYTKRPWNGRVGRFAACLFFATCASPTAATKRKNEFGMVTNGVIAVTSNGDSRASAMIWHSIS